MKKLILLLIVASFSTDHLNAQQQYKLRQATSMTGMKTESTIYVKGKRKRTESPGIMGMSNPTIIEQCDLHRIIKINDKKKVYLIQPMGKEEDEVIDEDQKPAPTAKPKPVVAASNNPQKGGVITNWYTITDTGERKKMFGFTARHIWTYQKMKPSADACYMKDSMMIKSDGWYIDLPDWSCPISYRPASGGPSVVSKPECTDRYVTRRKGKGKLGFPLIEKRTVQMGGGSEFETDLETLEFSTAKLDSMLFEIPTGYTEVKSEAELEDKMNMADMLNQAKQQGEKYAAQQTSGETQKKTGIIRIGVYAPKAETEISASDLQRDLALFVTRPTVEGVVISSEEDAKSKNCDYTLATDFVKFKQASKIGGLIKAVKNTDPNAASSFNVEASLLLKKLADGSTKTQQKVNGKYEGKPDVAAKKVLEEGSRLILDALQ